ncbi:MAG: alpha/beta hydrolase, partial [Betaproteobacteria bacterium]|nr:alpha/beta hydrolase [Betaproteobacteria bacterium]
ALIVPGKDASHATSAARYLEECLPRAHYWDAPPSDQTEQSANARLLEFLHTASTTP